MYEKDQINTYVRVKRPKNEHKVVPKLNIKTCTLFLGDISFLNECGKMQKSVQIGTI